MVIEAYNKAQKVITSCENLTQMESALTYVNIFFEAFAKKSGRYRTIYKVDPIVAEMYNDLLLNYASKKRTLQLEE